MEQRSIVRALTSLDRKRGGTAAHRLLPIAAALAAALLAHFLAPEPLGPVEVAGTTRHGGPALEAAFALSLLAAAVFAFRSMDVLFRFAGLRPLLHLPLSSSTLGRDRVAAILREASFAATLLAIPFLGLLLRAPAQALAAAALAAAGPLLGALAGFAFNVLAGFATLRPNTRLARTVSGATGDITGAWHFAPGAAFTLTAVSLLLAKLGIDELLRPLYVDNLPHTPRAALVALGLASIPALLLALQGFAVLTRHAHALIARFQEGDVVQRDAADHLFHEAPSPPGPLERMLTTRIALLVRKDRLLLARARPFVRMGTPVIALVTLLTRWAAPDALPPAAWGLLLAGWLVLVLRPWSLLHTLDGHPHNAPSAGLASLSERNTASALAATQETLGHAAILSLPLLLAGGPTAARIIALGLLWLPILFALTPLTRQPSDTLHLPRWLAASAVAIGLAQLHPTLPLLLALPALPALLAFHVVRSRATSTATGTP